LLPDTIWPEVVAVDWLDLHLEVVAAVLHLEGVEKEDRLEATPLDLDRVEAFLT
jgi:hypothetical protein